MKPTPDLTLILAALLLSQLTLCIGGCTQAQLAEWTYPSTADMRRGQEDQFDQLLAQSNLTRGTVVDGLAIVAPEKAAELAELGSRRASEGRAARDAAVARIPERVTGTQFLGVDWWGWLLGAVLGALGLDNRFGTSRTVKSAAKLASKKLAEKSTAALVGTPPA